MTISDTRTWSVVVAPAADGPDDEDAWAARGVAAVSRACDLETYGHADLAYTTEQVLARLHEQTYAERTWLVATAPGALGDAAAVAGAAALTLPREGNTHLAWISVLVRPGARGRGAGRQLLEEAQRRAAAAGRRTFVVESEHGAELPAGHPDALEPPTGSGRVDRTSPGAAFALANGYVLGQAERYSVLDLPVPEPLLDDLERQARTAAGDAYRLAAWDDRTPDDLVDAFAVLETAMSTAPPAGAIDVGEEPWDADRVRVYEGVKAEAGLGWSAVAVQHVPSGRLVGMTAVEYPLDAAEVVFQGDTIVLEEHRGHRLGLLVKTAMLRRLAQRRPGARRVHTWNAEENSHMLAINVALGFRPRGVAAMWQRVVGDEGGSAPTG